MNNKQVRKYYSLKWISGFCNFMLMYAKLYRYENSSLFMIIENSGGSNFRGSILPISSIDLFI